MFFLNEKIKETCKSNSAGSSSGIMSAEQERNIIKEIIEKSFPQEGYKSFGRICQVPSIIDE